MANLIVWRHAQAEELSASGNDAERALTPRGIKDASKMARWLQQHLPENYEILSSPARRCLQTAAALEHISGRKKPHPVTIAPFLATGGAVEVMLAKLLNTDSSQNIVLVGHQPLLGEFIAKVLGMAETAFEVKKGAVWWLRQRAIADSLSTTAADGHAAAKSAMYLFTVKPPRY